MILIIYTSTPTFPMVQLHSILYYMSLPWLHHCDITRVIFSDYFHNRRKTVPANIVKGKKDTKV